MKRRALSRKNLGDAAPPRLKAGIGLATRLVPQSLLLGRLFRRSLRFVSAAQDLLSLEALRALSPIDRQTVHEHLDDMLTVDPSFRGIDYVSTGGTSGTPPHFFVGSDRSGIEYAYLVAGWG
jgi:hypothetical protein